ncbi:MAG: phosphatase PAP2 family protein [Actinocatenispora sp.]
MYSGQSAVVQDRSQPPETSGTYGRSSRTGVRQLGAGLALGVALLLLGFLVSTGPVTAADTGVLRAVSHLRNGLFTVVAQLFTLIATPELWAALGFVIPVVLYLTRRRGQALRVLCVLIGSTGVTYVAKALVDEHRPPRSLWVETPDSGSFPSGHTTAATAIVVCALILAPVAARRAVAITGAVFILAVAASRFYLGVHYVPDTAGGVLSTACATVFLTGLSHLPPGRRWLLQLDDASR